MITFLDERRNRATRAGRWSIAGQLILTAAAIAVVGGVAVVPRSDAGVKFFAHQCERGNQERRIP